MHVTLAEGPLNCLSLNRDCTHVVTAGRNAFKVFSIEEDEFVEKYNMRIGRNLNLNYSAVDVTWNPIDENILASAATNGAVVTWNLSKTSRNKQDQVFMEHKRCVSKVAFHSNEYQLLMSGSQDGHMKIFDMRKKGVTSNFNGKSDSVRDIQFSPHHYFLFLASFDNGNVQVWDMRNPSKWERQFTAHNGPVFSIDIHPDEKNWVATSGRDKLIKIWDMSNPQRIKNSHSVQTIASVARIKWRPQRKYHIASCSLLVDFSVNVWDIRRPYIPFGSFNEHKDVVTGIQWKPNEPHQFYTSSKDNTLYQHMFRDAVRPADNANPVSVDININGNIIQATSDKLLSTANNSRSSYSQTMLPSIFRRAPDRSEQFTMVTSVLSEFDYMNLSEDLSMEWFTQSAQRYKLTGKSLQEICEHNAKVAEQLNRPQVCQTWNMLKLLYTSSPVTPPPNTVTRPHLLNKLDMTTHKEKDTEVSDLPVGAQNSVNYDTDARDNKGDNSTVSEDDSDNPETELDSQRDMTLTNIASGMGNRNNSDFFFQDPDQDLPVGYHEYDMMSNMTNGQEWSLPTEAFSVRLDIESQRPHSPDPHQSSGAPGNDSPASDLENDTSVSTLHQSVIQSHIRQELLSTGSFLEHLTTWEFKSIVLDMLQHYADRGDVQTVVSVLIVLGDRIKPLVDEIKQEQWFMSYIDLLTRFKMYSMANVIIKLSNHPVISTLNHQSTTIHVSCSMCNKPMSRSGWLCERCRSYVHTCSICHLPVKGVFVWCQGCAHGGHVDHIKEWLEKYKMCPTGCGHLCEYT